MNESDAHRKLVELLGAARLDNGSQSLRSVAARTDYSHTTVAKAFHTDAALLSWPVIEQIARSVHADLDQAHRLWQCAAGRALPATEQASVLGIPTPPRASTRTVGASLMIWLLAILIGVIAIAVTLAVGPGTAVTTHLVNMTQLAGSGAAAGLLYRRAFAFRGSRMQRHNLVYFGLFATAALATFTGQALWLIAGAGERPAAPTLGMYDIAYILVPLCAGAAAWMRARLYGCGELIGGGICGGYMLVIVFSGTYCAAMFVLTVLRFDNGNTTLYFALYPATDITVAALASGALLCGYRVFGSAVLSAAFLAYAASDIGYLLLAANPHSRTIPPGTGMGFGLFGFLLVTYALNAKPLPSSVLHAYAERRSYLVITGTMTLFAVTAAALGGATLWLADKAGLRSVMLAIIVTITVSAVLVINSRARAGAPTPTSPNSPASLRQSRRGGRPSWPSSTPASPAPAPKG